MYVSTRVFYMFISKKPNDKITMKKQWCQRNKLKLFKSNRLSPKIYYKTLADFYEIYDNVTSFEYV